MRNLSMKQISLIVSVIVFSILLLTVIIILNFTKGDVRVDVLKDSTKVGLILGGPKDDRSWGQSHYEALISVADDLNLEIICRDNVPGDEKCSDVIRELAASGCRIIIANSLGYGKYINAAAAEFPDIWFLHATGLEEAPNICTFFGRMYQIRYLSGIVAGLQTETGSIGYVASFPISEVNRGINAFTLGVRSVNPDAVVHVAFCESWDDGAAAKSCAEKLMDSYDTDIMTMHTNSAAPLEAANERGIWTIGYNYDNSDVFPYTYLTGCVWNWEPYYREQILACLQGKFSSGYKWLGIESGIVKLVDPAETGNAVPACREALEKARTRFDTFSFDVFYGPIRDNTGEIRIPEGESMSDVNMLNRFDWYVEGVEID